MRSTRCSTGVAELYWSTKATTALRSYDDYLRPRSAKVADALLTEVDGLCHLIADFPKMGTRIQGTKLRYHITRKYRYRVIYRIVRQGIVIRDVLHPSRAGP